MPLWRNRPGGGIGPLSNPKLIVQSDGSWRVVTTRGERPIAGPPFTFLGMRELRLHLEIAIPAMKVFQSHAEITFLRWVTGDTFLAAARAVEDFMRLRGLDTSYEKVYGALSCVIHTEFPTAKNEVVNMLP